MSMLIYLAIFIPVAWLICNLFIEYFKIANAVDRFEEYLSWEADDAEFEREGREEADQASR